ncbi:MAG: hypothetical protein ACKVZJ_01660 [Phycisphaerales bacterium]
MPLLTSPLAHRCLTQALLIAAALLSGCQLTKQEQLESVAKDWCMTIRASQVIPVYPLTEDIHPGDVFLVQVPVDRQQEIYKKRGFLPLDNHLARLHPTGYEQFYNNSFLPKRTDNLPNLMPRLWIRPDGTAEEWGSAPGAAFPTYTFQVNRSIGFNLAIPISGVPVGLSLLGTDSAYGSVAIKESKTIGVDIMSLEDQLQEFASQNRGFLSSFGVDPGDKPRNFLRVITRVYSTGKLDVQLSDARSVAVGGDVGAPRPVDNFIARTPTSAADVRDATNENYERGLERLNSMLADRDVPTHASGDDSNLTAAEVKAKREARAKELKDRRDAEILKLEETKTAAEGPVRDRDAARKPLDAKIKELADKQREVDLKTAAFEKAKNDGANDTEVVRLQNEASAATAQRDALKTEKDTLQRTWDGTATAAAKEVAKLEFQQQLVSKLSQALPGASLRVSAAASRFISLTETFDPPLVIGYLGFDVPILLGGTLGEPIPTHATIDPSLGIVVSPRAQSSHSLIDGNLLNSVYGVIAKDDSEIARDLVKSLDRLARHVPDVSPSIETDSSGTMTLKPRTRASFIAKEPGAFANYIGYRTTMQNTINAARSIIDSDLITPLNVDPNNPALYVKFANREGLDRLIERLRRELSENAGALEFARLRREALRYYSASQSRVVGTVEY